MFQNLAEKAGKESWSLNQDKIALFFFYLLILFFPTQFGKHFFPNFSFVYGLRIDYLSPTLYVTDVFIFCMFIFSSKTFFKNILAYKKNLLYFLLFTLSLFIGVEASKNSYAGFYGIIKFLEFSFLVIFIYFNYFKINKSKIVTLLGISILFEVALSVLQIINQGSLQGVFYFFGERLFNGQTPGIANAEIGGKLFMRPYGTFSHPNVLAGFLELSLILLLLIKEKTNKYLIFALTIGTLGILLSLSRTAIVAWGLFLIILFISTIFEKYKKGKVNTKTLTRFLVATSVLVLIFVFFSSSVFVQRFTKLSLSDETIVQREILASQAIKMISANPVFGVGINNYLNNLSPNFNSPLLLQPVHNIFLLIFAQTGIIGLLGFCSPLLLVVKKAFTKNINIYKLGIILSIVFIGSLDHYLLTLQQGQLILAILIGFCLTKVK